MQNINALQKRALSFVLVGIPRLGHRLLLYPLHTFGTILAIPRIAVPITAAPPIAVPITAAPPIAVLSQLIFFSPTTVGFPEVHRVLCSQRNRFRTVPSVCRLCLVNHPCMDKYQNIYRSQQRTMKNERLGSSQVIVVLFSSFCPS